MKTPGIGKWRSDAAHQRFVEMEDELWSEHWPRPPTALDLGSFAGTTRVYRWPGDGEAVVFLHGMGGTGLSWSPYVERFAGCDVYAVDTIGDVGRSEQREVIADAASLATWLDETLAGAGLERAHLAGTSYGGFLALNLAARTPKRVASLTVIDSAGLAPFRLGRFMLWGMPMLLGSLAPRRLRERLARSRPMLEDPRDADGAAPRSGTMGSVSPLRSRSPTTSCAPSRRRRRCSSRRRARRSRPASKSSGRVSSRTPPSR